MALCFELNSSSNCFSEMTDIESSSHSSQTLSLLSQEGSPFLAVPEKAVGSLIESLKSTPLWVY